MASKKPTGDESLVTNFVSIGVEYPFFPLSCIAVIYSGDLLSRVLMLILLGFFVFIGSSFSVHIEWGLQWKQ